VGTSTSHRSPSTPRWRPVAVGLAEGLPSDRIRSEIFNAGDDWVGQFTSPAVAAYVETLLESHSLLGESLRSSERPEYAIAALVSDARTRALDLSGGEVAAVAIAERAFSQVVTALVRSDRALADSTPDQAADAWERQRGAVPSDLLRPFLGRVLGQFAAHVVSRDIGEATGGEVIRTSRDAREVTAKVAASAAAIAETLPISPTSSSADWPAAVRLAFRRAARLPERGSQ
jgi:hypothetical protein